MVRSFLSARWPMGPMALTPSLLHSVLVDETADNAYEMQFKSVCFSPDGKLLATVGEDKVVRVSSRSFVSVIATAVVIISKPNAQHKTNFGAPRFGISPRGES